MVFEEVDIGFHIFDLLFDLLEFGVDIFVVSIELGLALDSFFLFFGFDGYLIHGFAYKNNYKSLMQTVINKLNLIRIFL